MLCIKLSKSTISIKIHHFFIVKETDSDSDTSETHEEVMCICVDRCVGCVCCVWSIAFS